jgi:hypothetical protein
MTRDDASVQPRFVKSEGKAMRIQHAETYHPHATDADIVDAIAETLRASRAMSWPNAGRVVWRRLADAYGEKLVERALRVAVRLARREQQALRREERSLKRQVKQAKAAYLMRSAEGL